MRQRSSRCLISVHVCKFHGPPLFPTIPNYAEVEAAVAAVVKDFGRLDVMIANAGIPSKAGGLDSSIADWDRARAVDFDGAYYCARAAGLVFKAQGHGNCIFTVSMSGHAANVPHRVVIMLAKLVWYVHLSLLTGILTDLVLQIHLWKSLAVEWAKWGGRVNSVSPGYIDTAISGDCPFEMKEACLG